MSKPSKKRNKPDSLQNTQKVRFTLRQARAGRPVMTVKEIFILLKVFGLVTTIYMRSTRKYLTN